jgi:hypothetical protein
MKMKFELKAERRIIRWNRSTLYALKQIRFVMWYNKFYYR